MGGPYNQIKTGKCSALGPSIFHIVAAQSPFEVKIPAPFQMSASANSSSFLHVFFIESSPQPPGVVGMALAQMKNRLFEGCKVEGWVGRVGEVFMDLGQAS